MSLVSRLPRQKFPTLALVSGSVRFMSNSQLSLVMTVAFPCNKSRSTTAEDFRRRSSIHGPVVPRSVAGKLLSQASSRALLDPLGPSKIYRRFAVPEAKVDLRSQFAQNELAIPARGA